jgi:hypothetical protein
MSVKNPNGFALRQTVARRLRKFYAEWTAQLAAGTSELWRLVEYRLAVKNEAESAVPRAGDLPPASMQQQPMQQQQMKASPKKT